jgi:tetratricopeptide (TPR) repeat protein
MNPSRVAIALWPGLPELWYRGRWSALVPAIVFTCALNFLIVARYVYPEWLVPALVRLACWVGLATWVVLTIRAVGRIPALLHPRSVSGEPDQYDAARTEYLQGNWTAAEALLAKCLEIDPRDCPALLLLASVYRQTDRLQAAERILESLDRLETADHWWLERQTERRRLSRARSAQNPPSPQTEISAEPDVSSNVA